MQWIDIQTVMSHDAELDSNFGYAVGIAADWVAVGAPDDDLSDQLGNAGSVDLFHHDAGQWKADGTLLEAPPGRGNHFGQALALASNVLLIGSPYADDFTHTGIAASGRAHLYRHLGTWHEEQKLAPSDEKDFGLFGRSVDLDDEFALVGRFWGSHAYGFANVAYSSNYGAGWPGWNGVPGFVLKTSPLLGDRVEISIANSSPQATTAAMVIGVQPAELPTGLGGTLYVIPLEIPFFFIPPAGLEFSRKIPGDAYLDGVALYAQVLEIDSFASRGVSFSKGLRVSLGTSPCDS